MVLGRLCDEHFLRHRRVVTSLAVSPAMLAQMMAETECTCGRNHEHHMALFMRGEAVAIVDLPVPEPTILSDRDPRG